MNSKVVSVICAVAPDAPLDLVVIDSSDEFVILKWS